ncbi:MAG: DUF429 domain-containing protein [Candidatus Atribacteria bacterium]|nr:DUF429 domain-containing protein [Candidatus Atribacteria bacterium]MCD6350467.1 DUF429 domain-containing protein [Candidatus Atribacteria bacterium]
MRTYKFIAGIDLSWSLKKDSWVALAELKGSSYRFCDIFALKTLADFGCFFSSYPSLLIAVDAPLRIPDSCSNRRPERELLPLLRKVGWGILPINHFFVFSKFSALFKFQDLLEKHRFWVAPLPDYSKKHVAIEVFASLNAISLCGEVKAARQRSELFWKKLFPHLREETDSLFADNAEEVIRSLLLKKKKGRDVVDALLCLYTAWVVAVCPERTRVFGNSEEGFIVVPLSRFSPAWLIP